MSLREKLPNTLNQAESINSRSNQQKQKNTNADVQQIHLIPSYGQRDQWKPKSKADFGDGGAYPEIMLAQYPLGMGKNTKKHKGQTIPLRTDEQGNIKFDYVVRFSGNTVNNSQLIQSSIKDLQPLSIPSDDQSLQLPTLEQANQVAERTRQALDSLVQEKIKLSNPTQVTKKQQDQFIRYTPQNPDQQLGITQRVVRMVEAPVDPMEPPRFKIKKNLKRPPSPSAPVLHAASKPLTEDERKQWYIPPVVSNWKNPNGFVVPLDKRIAADGRSLQEVQINDRFSKFSEALYIADKHAREEIERAAALQRKIAQKQREEKEAKLREMAQSTRNQNNY